MSLLQISWWGWCHLLLSCRCAEWHLPCAPGLGILKVASWFLQSMPPSPCVPSVLDSGRDKLPFYPPMPRLPLLSMSAPCFLPAAASVEGLPLLSFLPFFCRTPVPHCLHRFQEKLKKPRDTRCPPLSVFWHGSIIHLRKLQLRTVGGKKPDWTFCALLLLECVVPCSLAISRWLPVLFQWPWLVFLVHRADSKT